MTWMAASPTGAHDHAGAAAGVTTMPGMASADELKKLRSATGKDLDVDFLQLMLRHHQGGATMLSDAAQNASQEPVRNLAAQMLSAQTAEAQYLTQLLTRAAAHPSRCRPGRRGGLVGASDHLANVGALSLSDLDRSVPCSLADPHPSVGPADAR